MGLLGQKPNGRGRTRGRGDKSHRHAGIGVRSAVADNASISRQVAGGRAGMLSGYVLWVVALVGAGLQCLFAYREVAGWNVGFVAKAAPAWVDHLPAEKVPPKVVEHIDWARHLAFNMGVYNLVLALGLVWILVAGAAVAGTLGNLPGGLAAHCRCGCGPERCAAGLQGARGSRGRAADRVDLGVAGLAGGGGPYGGLRLRSHYESTGARLVIVAPAKRRDRRASARRSPVKPAHAVAIL